MRASLRRARHRGWGYVKCIFVHCHEYARGKGVRGPGLEYIRVWELSVQIEIMTLEEVQNLYRQIGLPGTWDAICPVPTYYTLVSLVYTDRTII